MIETAIEPILLDVDVSVEEYDLDLDVSVEEYDLDLDTKIEVNKMSGGNMPLGGNPGDIIIKRSTENFDAEWVPPANSVEQDNTRPITAAAVYTEIGNINALLATI